MELQKQIASVLPYSESPAIRERVEELFSRKMLGAVLIGKFTGDYAAIKTVQLLGTDVGYILGILLTISIFIYWEKIQQKAYEQKEKMNPAQTRLSRFEKDKE